MVSHQTRVERTIEEQLTLVTNSHTEVLDLIKQKKSILIREATTLTNITCVKCSERHKPKDKAICCDDCSKPKFKVPTEADCTSTGCSHSCVFSNSTCDAAGKTQAPCLFPFRYLGVEHKECVSYSPFGLTRRPWCYTDTEPNRAAMDHPEQELRPAEWGFCDCTSIRCTCPEGQKLAADKKKCE
jgi:hypothetical protein